MSDHYSLIVRPDLSIDLAMLMRLAHRAAAQEHAAFREIGATAWTYRRCLSQAMHHAWGFVQTRREIMQAERQQAAAPPRLDPVASIRRELELLPYREDYRAAQARRRDLESALAQVGAA
jgi:hypothetical protein